MRVLIACEFSGIVRDAFSRMGHDAWSCDVLDSERPGNHIKGSVLNVLGDGWDLMIAHPPCTYLANSGVRWLYIDGQKNEVRWALMGDASAFFIELLSAPIPRIAIENPIMHRHARNQIDTPYTQIVQPYQFGHGETKATCLWLHNLPRLTPTNCVEGRIARVHQEAPSAERWKNRSRTYQGIADAMAAQWGIEDSLPVVSQRSLFNLMEA